MATENPIACTLSPRDYRARLVTIADLRRDALRHVEQRGCTIELHYAPEAAARVRTLVEQERTCCAFLSFDLREEPDAVRLLVTVPAAAAEVVPELLDELTGRVR